MPTTAVDFSLLNDVEPGDKLTIRFKRDAIDDLVYLEAMVRGGYVKVPSMTHALIMGISQSGSWDGDRNRTMTVTVTDRFDPKFFIGRMRQPIESLEIGCRRPLIDPSVLVPGTTRLILRFKANGFDGVAELDLLLSMTSLITAASLMPLFFSSAGIGTLLERIYVEDTWSATGGERGFRLEGVLDTEIIQIIRESILPHLELLRANP